MAEVLPFNGGFSPDRFRRYAQDLARAIYEMSEEYKSEMGSLAKLKEALGSDNVKLRYGNGKQYVTMDDKTVELPAEAGPEDVAKALGVNAPPASHEASQPTPLPSVTFALDGVSGDQQATKPQEEVSKEPDLKKPTQPTAPISKNRTGAGYFANMIRTQQAAFKEQFAKAGQEMQAALEEMKELADAATQEAKHVKAEAADLRAALGLNSNGEPE